MNQAIQQAMTIRLDYELPEYPAFVPAAAAHRAANPI